jgi:hypothetical protein
MHKHEQAGGEWGWVLRRWWKGAGRTQPAGLQAPGACWRASLCLPAGVTHRAPGRS